WGGLLAPTPALVALVQLRLTRRVAAVPAAVKLPAGVLIMGGSLLALAANASVATIAAVVVVFVFGEMLWAPTASAAAAALAPDERRGAYMGAFGSTVSAGFAVGPVVALQLRGAVGDRAMWMFFGATALAASLAALATVHQGGQPEVERAIAAAAAAWTDWSRTPWEERAAVMLRAAELLAGPWRATVNAATMLGQSKTAHQAEIDAACELTDFLRFNVEFMTRIYDEQPISSPGVWNRMEYRPLEGFVFAVTPFNFTAIAGNLPSSAALMGNTVVWKPASTAAYSAWFLMQLFEAAGLPPGVINLVYGNGPAVGNPALASPDLAGIHFTGST